MRKHYIVYSASNGTGQEIYVTKAYNKTDAFNNWKKHYGLEGEAKISDVPDSDEVVEFIEAKEIPSQDYNVLGKYVSSLRE